ncbi:inositol transport system sugar-binding protein [Klebsiella pneumoniae]|uniref:Inositol transport system sugar-binding protein n=1 Tax=Klebsiella pneumoniae TaxID=573 RepID=A0A3S4GKU7_KLEPN|nr:inositol transport system sugar-binding protein [Klebsiella pneumoniae]
MLPAVVMAKDVSIGVSMALFDDNFLTILRTSMQKEMKKMALNRRSRTRKGMSPSKPAAGAELYRPGGGRPLSVNPVDTNAVKPIMDQGHQSRDPAGVCETAVRRRS